MGDLFTPELDSDGWAAWLTFKQDRRQAAWATWPSLAAKVWSAFYGLPVERQRRYVDQARNALTKYMLGFSASSTYSLDAGMPVTSNGGGSNGVQFMRTTAGSASGSESRRNGPPVRYRNGSPRSR